MRPSAGGSNPRLSLRTALTARCTDAHVARPLLEADPDTSRLLVPPPFAHRVYIPVMMNGAGAVKISDFGISSQLADTTAFCSTFVGTTCYMSPERLSGDAYSYPADIWAYGAPPPYAPPPYAPPPYAPPPYAPPPYALPTQCPFLTEPA